MTASIPPPMKQGELPDPLAHRYLLGQPLDYRPFAGSDLCARLGGQATVDRLVDLLYDGFEADPALRPLFPRDLTGGRAGQKMFLAQWLGGSHRYAERSYSGLVHRHESVPITRSVAGLWLHHFQQALTRTVAGETDGPPASRRSPQPACTTPRRPASWEPSRYYCNTEPIPPRATPGAAHRWTGWRSAFRQRPGSRSATS